MSRPGEIAPDQLRQIFVHKIRPTEYDAVALGPSESVRELVIVGGQPGAGKTRSIAQAARAHPGIVPVVGDDLRAYHPLYRQMMTTDPLRMPEVTAQAAGAWVGMSLDYLQAQGRSILLETTLRKFRAAGYRTELRVLAVPAELSRMGTVSRYVGQVADDGAGRWAPSHFHDAAYANAFEAIARAASAGLVDRVVVVDRNANVLADQVIGPKAAAHHFEELRAVIDAGREISAITPTQGQRWMAELVDCARHLTAWGETDPDLLDTMRRLSGRADAVAARAWPGDPARAVQVAERAREAVKTLTGGT